MTIKIRIQQNFLHKLDAQPELMATVFKKTSLTLRTGIAMYIQNEPDSWKKHARTTPLINTMRAKHTASDKKRQKDRYAKQQKASKAKSVPVQRIMRKKGRLIASILGGSADSIYHQKGKMWIEFGTKLFYATIQDKGKRIKMSNQMRKYLGAIGALDEKSAGKKSVTIPARPLVPRAGTAARVMIMNKVMTEWKKAFDAWSGS